MSFEYIILMCACNLIAPLIVWLYCVNKMIYLLQAVIRLEKRIDKFMANNSNRGENE